MNILPVICYNQIQAQLFQINSTKAILMNYFSYILPNYWEAMNINGLPYYWCGINKILHDMPTLDIWETALRNNIRELIKDWLILRELTSTKAFYRASDKWIKSSSTAGEVKKRTLLEEINSLPPKEREELINKVMPSPSVENKIILDLDWFWGNFYTDEIISFFQRWKDLFQFSATIDEQYLENILKHIDYRMSLTTYWELWPDGKKTDKTKKEIIKRLNNILDWHEAKNKKIKNLKLTLNTFLK